VTRNLVILEFLELITMGDHFIGAEFWKDTRRLLLLFPLDNVLRNWTEVKL